MTDEERRIYREIEDAMPQSVRDDFKRLHNGEGELFLALGGPSKKGCIDISVMRGLHYNSPAVEVCTVEYTYKKALNFAKFIVDTVFQRMQNDAKELRKRRRVP